MFRRDGSNRWNLFNNFYGRNQLSYLFVHVHIVSVGCVALSGCVVALFPFRLQADAGSWQRLQLETLFFFLTAKHQSALWMFMIAATFLCSTRMQWQWLTIFNYSGCRAELKNKIKCAITTLHRVSARWTLTQLNFRVRSCWKLHKIRGAMKPSVAQKGSKL